MNCNKKLHSYYVRKIWYYWYFDQFEVRAYNLEDARQEAFRILSFTNLNLKIYQKKYDFFFIKDNISTYVVSERKIPFGWSNRVKFWLIVGKITGSTQRLANYKLGLKLNNSVKY